MKKKTTKRPQIGWNTDLGQFTKDNILIDSFEARQRWDATDSDWTSGAYTEMAARVMKETA